MGASTERGGCRDGHHTFANVQGLRVCLDCGRVVEAAAGPPGGWRLGC